MASALPGVACPLFWPWFALIRVACARLLPRDGAPCPLVITKDSEGRHSEDM